MACDECADRYFAVQRNTIERFKPGVWVFRSFPRPRRSIIMDVSRVRAVGRSGLVSLPKEVALTWRF